MSAQHLPDKQCDLVMKGGVTSGIVYPPAMLELQKEYIFNSIGGTSAGAVAAAAAAAAEYGRQDNGFERFRQASDSFGSDLLAMFAAPKETRPVMELLKSVGAFGGPAGKKPTLLARVLGAFGSLARNDTIPFILGVLIGGFAGLCMGVGLALLLALLFTPEIMSSTNQSGLAILGGIFFLIGACIGGTIGGGLHLVFGVLLKQVPHNFYGVVNGHDPNLDPANPQLLTDYLSSELNHIAGLKPDDGPLTFGHLCRRKLRRNGIDEDAGITLQMITTNINQGIPYRLPFTQRIFLFKREEMERLFPADIVNHLVEHRYHSTRLLDDLSPAGPDGSPPKILLPGGYYFLPDPDDLPVVVAMRMSLAIPIIFSAIPLYTIKLTSFEKARKGTRLTVNDLQRNLFSDGGITSNFPIHSFDKWLPTRPTFGITLASMPTKAIRSEEGDSLDADYLSLVNERGGESDILAELGLTGTEPAIEQEEHTLPAVEIGHASRIATIEWRPVDSPITLLQRVVDTARESHDYMQSVLPGYRERIVKIRFSQDEGGLNLAMDQGAIDAIRKKGRAAGLALINDFSFDQHRWTRYLVLMSELEIQLQKMRGALERGDYRDLLLNRVGIQPANDNAADNPDDTDTDDDDPSTFPYMVGHGHKWRHKAYHCTTALVDVLDRWEEIAAGQLHEPTTEPPAANPTPIVTDPQVDTPAPVTPTIPNCDSASVPLTLFLFNSKPPKKDPIPKPRPILRVTPDM